MTQKSAKYIDFDVIKIYNVNVNDKFLR